MPIYTYRCEAGHEADGRARYGDFVSIPCPICKQPAERQSVYLITPFTETGVKVGRRTEVPLDQKRIRVSKFQEAAAELDYEHKKHEESLQRELPTPDYFHEGYRQGYAIAKGKRPPTTEKF